MLVKEDFVDLTVSNQSSKLRVYFYVPNLPEYPYAKFPGVVVFTEIYQVTGPLHRFCRQIASHGYVVACPESFHEFEEPGVAIPYDQEGTDRGNQYKVLKELSAYDEDAKLVIDALVEHPNSNGRIGATGMCLGGHLAFRAAFDSRVLATVCYFATDIHTGTLSKTGDDSLKKSKDIEGELLMIWGKQDTHVDRQGRDLIRKTLEDSGKVLSWCEFQAQHAFIRDELSKGRYDAALAKVCFDMLLELFHRKLYLDLGNKVANTKEIEHVC
ncbi:dienelactone hydrolase [Umbelopsis sp. PMI_123]|nr:dienelactone hydrolase [Umbelopsis sp. PMI_123]